MTIEHQVTLRNCNSISSITHPTFDDVHQACVSQISNINAYEIDTIVGIARGGLSLSVTLSHLTELPMSVIEYSSKVGNGDNKNHANDFPHIPGKRILLVDDICDSSETLREVTRFYKTLGYEVFSYTMYFKDMEDDKLIKPDIWSVKIPKHFGWVKFPWEK